VIGADTNIVLRFVLADDVHQSPRARAFFDERTPGDPAFISMVTLAEIAWVLRAVQKWSRAQVFATIRGLLGSDRIVVEHEQLVIRALHDSEDVGADLADALVSHRGIAAGCDYTVTFDRKAADLPGMLAL
jgi:predicted nucleic-acid-binding protein